MLRSTLGVLAAGAGLSALVAAQGPPAVAPAPRESAPAKPVDASRRKAPPDADLRDLQTQAAWAKKEPKPRKVNGAIFTVRASAEHKFAGDVIVLDWSLDYDGRRAPLVIVGPTLDTGRTRGATKVNLYAAPAGGNAAWTVRLSGLTFNPAQRADPPRVSPLDMWGISGTLGQDMPKELFLTVWPEKPATGTFRVPANRLREELGKKGADHAFDPKTPPRVFAEVLHEPDDRGETHDLDAWTGKLRSDVVEVPALKCW